MIDSQRIQPVARAVVALALCLATLACSKPVRESGRPGGPLAGRDVVLIVIDTLRQDALNALLESGDAPHIARLAERGVVFEHARSASSWTAPATASLFTSLHPDQHGVVTGMRMSQRLLDHGRAPGLNRIPDGVETLPELFRAAGYATLGLADNPNVGAAMGFARGFDELVTTDYVGGEQLNAALSARWAGPDSEDSPRFLYLHYMDPHSPYHERAPWFQAPAGTETLLDSDPGELSDEQRALLDRARYDSEIAYVDQLLGAALERVASDALVVLTSDHGEEFFEHGKFGHGFQVYEELLRVPLIVAGPDEMISSGRHTSTPVSTIDLLPTFRELLGQPPNPGDEGESLGGYLLGRDGAPPGGRTLYAQRTEELRRTAVRLRAAFDGEFKLILSSDAAPAELYDLDADPLELGDLAATRRADLKPRRAALLAFERRLLRFERTFGEDFELTPETGAMLERLGYVEGE